MIKKITRVFLLFLILLVVVKGCFFSGRAYQPAPGESIRPAGEHWVWAKVSSQYHRNNIGEFFLGKHYRSVWEVPVKVPVLHLDSQYGGLIAGKLGGGMQTTSLTLEDKKGNAYALRSLNKDPIGVLPPFWRKTLIADLIRDQISAANPYAALVVAPLANAAGIFHTNPNIFFVSASDKVLGNIVKKTGNHLFLLEEKFTQVPSAPHPFGPTTVILNSVEMLDKRFRYNTHVIDQSLLLRCRLFDIFIGDWDRHEGQWNWAAYPTATGVLYKPIPKDRDQAFSKYQDGVLPWLLTRDFALRKFGQFNSHPEDAVDYTINASFLDERALNALTFKDYQKAALDLKAALPDSVIEAAVKQFPLPVYRLVGAETTRILKDRRNQLESIAEAYYRVLAKKVTVTGSDEREKFIVYRLSQAKTQVQIFSLSDSGSTGRLLYQRMFTGAQTETITLHGLSGDDVFMVQGQVNTGITINIIGGLGADFIQDKSQVTEEGGKTSVYDTKKGNTIIWGKNTLDKTTSDISVHNYDREGY